MLALATLLLLTAPTAEAKGKPGRKSKKTEAAAEKADTTKKEKKGYEELLKGAVTDKGMFDVHRKGTDFLFEIPDSLMGREILIVNKISGVPYALNEAGVNKGMGYGEKIVRFRKDTLYKKVWVMTYDPRITSPEGDRITRSVKDNYRETAIEQFPIEAYGKDSVSVVIKVNKVFDGSEKSFNNVFGSIGLPGSPKKDLSKIESVKSFPENIIVKSLLSTSHTEEGTTVPLTVDITSNLVLLDREPMRPRFSDDRVGYFEIGHLYFNDEQQKAEERAFINRWRLEPKPEDVERYKRGELVEPQKPIVLWIDPATPPVWVPYIKKGIVEWQEAFEAAGFKNAIVAREVTPDDREFDIDDVRYSVVTYAASEMANAMGPSWVDPRSGEIINASVLMYNDVVKLAANWRFVQTAQVDERVRGKELPDDVFQESLEYILAHEVGHCLGLMHNMAASSAFPVDSLRSASFTQQHGTTPSIMDYARFNYVAQPGDKGVKLTPPDLGPYDDYVIKYAYTPLPDKKDMFDEEKTIRGWIDEKVGDPIYRYGRQQVIARYDPTAIEEDLGDDHIKAGDYGIGNLKYVLSHMEEWITDEEDPDLKIRTELYEAAAGQFARYVNAVMLNVGGIYLTDVNSNTAGGPQAVSVPKELQRASLKWVLAQMKDSAWLEQPALTEKLPLHVDLSFILRFNFCRAFFTYYKNVTLSSHIADDPYTPQEYMDDLYNIVFESTIKGRPVSPSERLIQRMFVDAAADVASSEAKRMKLGGIAEAYAPSVDEIALLGLDRSGIVERYLGPLREAEEEHGKGYVASQLWNSDALSSGYGWQYNVQLRSIDESRALFVNVNDRILKLLRSRVKSATGETRAHYQGMIYVLERSLFPSQKN